MGEINPQPVGRWVKGSFGELIDALEQSPGRKTSLSILAG
jgi:hypothetical protein